MKSYDNFAKSLQNLSEGAQKEPPYSLLEQTGMVALFEICFEQSWKLMKRLLEEHGRIVAKVASPRGIIKTAYECGMIDDEEGWLALLKTRNLLAHTYSDDKALENIGLIKTDFLPLFGRLKQEIDVNWLPGI